MSMILTLLGIHDFLTLNNEASFLDAEYFQLPEDMTAEDRAELSALILSESAEQEVVYPEPQTLCTVVKAWSHARVGAWARMLDALSEEYNPVHNYDRYEVETGTDTGTRTETDTGTRTETDTGTRSETEAEDIADTASDTTTGQVTGVNSNLFSDDKKTLSSGTGARDRDVSKQETRNLSHGETRNLSRGETRNLANSRNLHAFGNIGVTTAADMITQEITVRKHDIINTIKAEFINYFCLGIY